jgi:hypothetical protein
MKICNEFYTYINPIYHPKTGLIELLVYYEVSEGKRGKKEREITNARINIPLQSFHPSSAQL